MKAKFKVTHYPDKDVVEAVEEDTSTEIKTLEDILALTVPAMVELIRMNQKRDQAFYKSIKEFAKELEDES